MLSTMQDDQLSLAYLLQYGARLHANAEVATWTGSGTRKSTFAQVGKRSAQLAHALRSLGVTGDQRVGTFMWNNTEHLECYMAIPAMGAVLHTLNIRLFPEQLVYVANHAEDHVVIVDGSLIPLFAKQLPEMKTVKHVVVANGDPASLEAPSGVTVHSYEELLSGRPETFDWPEIDERSAAAMCYTSGTTGDPKGVVYSHRSIWLHSMQICMSNTMRLSDEDRALVIVPMFHAMSWGMPYAGFMVGASMVLPDRFLQPGPIAEILAAEKPTFAGAVPTIWQGLLQHLDANPQDISHLREVVVGRLGRAARDDARLRGALQRTGAARLGDDRDVADGQRGTATGGGDGASRRGSTATRRAASPPTSRPGSSTTTATRCRGTGRASANWRSRARGSPARTTATRTRRSSTTAGCAPVTSARSRPTGT
jgi:fatty-acyl-CoA synthase